MKKTNSFYVMAILAAAMFVPLCMTLFAASMKTYYHKAIHPPGAMTQTLSELLQFETAADETISTDYTPQGFTGADVAVRFYPRY